MFTNKRELHLFFAKFNHFISTFIQIFILYFYGSFMRKIEIVINKLNMFKQLTSGGIILFFLCSCSILKPNLTSNINNLSSAKILPEVNKEIKFLDEISTQVEFLPSFQKNEKIDNEKNVEVATVQSPKEEFKPQQEFMDFSALLFKYALLLNTEVEKVKNFKMFEFIDSWYGTRYCLGGVTKNCIDCSAFVQFLFAAVYETSLPRTAKEQFKSAIKVSKTDLQEGDLIFFNTRRGVSHVGVYLQNNKFVHAAVSGGVMISDLLDNYWTKKFIGVRRVEKKS